MPPNTPVLAQSVPAVTVTVKGAELALLYRNRAMEHRRKAEEHEKEIARRAAELESAKAKFGEPFYPTCGQCGAMQGVLPRGADGLDILVEHERAMHDYLAFMAEHLDRDASFVLGDAEVMALKGPIWGGGVRRQIAPFMPPPVEVMPP